jgi:hypothetical protein
MKDNLLDIAVEFQRVRIGYAIYLHGTPFYSPSSAKFIANWDGFTAQMAIRWKWYIEYRAALVKVDHPRCFVEIREYRYEADKNKALKKVLENRLLAAKRKRTEWKNKLAIFVEGWRELFPIEEDIRYQKAIEKIEEKERSILAIQKQIDGLS